MFCVVLFLVKLHQYSSHLIFEYFCPFPSILIRAGVAVQGPLVSQYTFSWLFLTVSNPKRAQLNLSKICHFKKLLILRFNSFILLHKSLRYYTTFYEEGALLLCTICLQSHKFRGRPYTRQLDWKSRQPMDYSMASAFYYHQSTILNSI